MVARAWAAAGVALAAVLATGMAPREARADDPAWDGARGDAAGRGFLDAPALLPKFAGRTWLTHLGSPMTAAPVLSGGTIFVASEAGEVVALDLATGWPRWRVALGVPVVATPAVAGATLVVASTDGSVVGLALADGREVARVALGEPVDAGVVPAGARVLVATRPGRLCALDWPAGRVRWQHALGGLVTAPPAMADGTAVVATVDGTLVACAMTDGHPVWSRPLGTPAPGGPAVDGGTVYVATSDARALALALPDGAAIFTVALPGPAAAPPALAGRRAVIATETGGIVALDRRDGHELWRRTLLPAAPVRVGPIVVDRLVLVAAADGAVHPLELADGRPLVASHPCGRASDERDAAGAGDVRLAPHAFGYVGVAPDGTVAAVRDPRGDRRLLGPLLDLPMPPPAVSLDALVARLDGPAVAGAARDLCRAGLAALPALARAVAEGPPAGRVAADAIRQHLEPLAAQVQADEMNLRRGLPRRELLFHCLAHPDPAVARAAAERYVAEWRRPLDGFDPDAPLARRRDYAEGLLKIIRD